MCIAMGCQHSLLKEKKCSRSYWLRKLTENNHVKAEKARCYGTFRSYWTVQNKQIAKFYKNISAENIGVVEIFGSGHDNDKATSGSLWKGNVRLKTVNRKIMEILL